MLFKLFFLLPHLEDGVSFVRHDGGVVLRLRLQARVGGGGALRLPRAAPRGRQVTGNALPPERQNLPSANPSAQ